MSHTGKIKNVVFIGHSDDDQFLLKNTYGDLGPTSFVRDEGFEWDEEVNYYDVWPSWGGLE